VGRGYGLVLALHILVSFLLVGVILVQGGRGGMAEMMGGSAAQSLFGGGANVVMTKITAVGAALFMVTCLSLAVLSSHRGRSVIERMPIALPDNTPATVPAGLLPLAPASTQTGTTPSAEAPAESPAASPTASEPVKPQ
jgi:preprotein translocase subunit SecG